MDYEGLENQSENSASERIFVPLDIPSERFRRIICNRLQHFTEYLPNVLKEEFWIIFPFRASSFGLKLARER